MLSDCKAASSVSCCVIKSSITPVQEAECIVGMYSLHEQYWHVDGLLSVFYQN